MVAQNVEQPSRETEELYSVVHGPCAHCKQAFEQGDRVVQVIVGVAEPSTHPEPEADESLSINKGEVKEYHISCYSRANTVLP